MICSIEMGRSIRFRHTGEAAETKLLIFQTLLCLSQCNPWLASTPHYDWLACSVWGVGQLIAGADVAASVSVGQCSQQCSLKGCAAL